MGYVTWYASRCDHLAFMSHDGCGYLTHSLGKELCHLMGTAWAWAMSYGHLAGRLFLDSLDCWLGIACVTLREWNGHGRRHMTGMIIWYVGWTWGMSHEGH